jgi:transmembrane sensor
LLFARDGAEARTYRTRLGEIRAVPLDDGSTVVLNTASTLSVAIDDESRRAELLGGEAFFDIARDPLRPFRVDAGPARLAALGTSFNVRKLSRDTTQVTVRDGVVEIARSDGGGEPAKLVPSQSHVLISPDGVIETRILSKEDLARELSWRNGMLSFEDTRLDQAVREFARYSKASIVIDDPAIAAETVTGQFAADQPEAFVEAAAETLGFRVRPMADGLHIAR